MTEDSNHKHELLLMAYLDGELDADDRARAEALISENPVYASQLEQWRENGNAIRSLPTTRHGGNAGPTKTLA